MKNLLTPLIKSDLTPLWFEPGASAEDAGNLNNCGI